MPLELGVYDAEMGLGSQGLRSLGLGVFYVHGNWSPAIRLVAQLVRQASSAETSQHLPAKRHVSFKRN